jgi:protease I
MAKNTLQGKTIAFLVANEGAEQIELTEPWRAVEEAGGRPMLIAPDGDKKVQAFNHLDKGDTFAVDMAVSDANPAEFDGLMLPGGVANPDQLRTVPDAVQFVKGFFDAKKPVAVICHGPWTLVEADAVRGKSLTSWPSLQTDIRNAGGNWVDEEVHVDEGLVTSRKPDDLPAFCAKAVEEIAEGKHEGQRATASGATA